MICGVDEAGKGAVFGPLVVAAVCCPTQEDCGRLGMRDSKTLTPRRREALYALVQTHFRSAVRIIEAPDVDRYLQEMTLNECLARAHAAVIDDLRPETAYVDACDVNAARHAETLRRYLRHPTRIVSEHHADRTYPVVGAASIVAKVVRDRRMAELRELHGALGSGYPTDPVTRQFLEEYVRAHHQPPPYARRTWRTVEDCLRALGQRELDEF